MAAVSDAPKLFSTQATFKFKKPVPTEKPLTCFSGQFLTRLKEIEGKN